MVRPRLNYSAFDFDGDTVVFGTVQFSFAAPLRARRRLRRVVKTILRDKEWIGLSEGPATAQLGPPLRSIPVP
jgi:hypothetical protein